MPSALCLVPQVPPVSTRLPEGDAVQIRQNSHGGLSPSRVGIPTAGLPVQPCPCLRCKQPPCLLGGSGAAHPGRNVPRLCSREEAALSQAPDRQLERLAGPLLLNGSPKKICRQSQLMSSRRNTPDNGFHTYCCKTVSSQLCQLRGANFAEGMPQVWSARGGPSTDL